MANELQALAGSGFPFQTAVAHAVRKTGIFRSIEEEVAWRSPTGTSGFHDIVAKNESACLCIDSKRTHNTSLIFLLPQTDPQTGQTMRAVYLTRISDSTNRPAVNVGSLYSSLQVYESAFCVMTKPTKSGGDHLLEKELRPLVEGTESYACDRVKVHGQNNVFCIPIMITTAELYVALYDPQTILLNDGIYKPEAKDLQSVEAVRFTKEFVATGPTESRKRTVIIARSSNLVNTLKKLSMPLISEDSASTCLCDPGSGIWPR